MSSKRRRVELGLYLAAIVLGGCGKGPQAKLQGSWVKPAENATLEITGSRVILKGLTTLTPGGTPIPIGVDVKYEVTREQGNVLDLDLIPPNGQRDKTSVTVGEDWLEFQNSDRLWGGRWTRK